jgi:hypothetical protein
MNDTYKWASPHEWFQSYLDRNRNNTAQLFQLCGELASKLDADQMQELFESDMDSDGYFKKVKP